MSARGEPPRKKLCKGTSVMSLAGAGVDELKHYSLCDKHYGHCFRSLAEMRQREELCDLTLLIGTKSFRVHKALMSSSIPFLRAMLTSGMKESRQEEIRLHDLDEEAMESIVNFCYTGDLSVSIETVYQLLSAANLLQMDQVRDVCCTFLKSRLAPDNCISVRCFADAHSFVDLRTAADQYTCRNFDAVVASDEFVQCDGSIVMSLLDSEVVQVPSEERIFHAIVRWVEYDLKQRSDLVLDMLQCLRFAKLSREFIEKSIIPCDIVQSTPNCEAFFQGVLAAHMGPHTKGRLPPLSIYVVGGRDADRCLDSCESFNPLQNTWSPIASMKMVRTAVSIVELDGYIYAIGGEKETQFSQYGTSYLNAVERYSIKQNAWEVVAPLNASRSFAASAAINGLVFAIGGEDGNQFSLSSVEVYDPRTNTWTAGPQLNMRRSGPGCCVIDGCIYVIGGCTAAVENYHMSVECLRPSPVSDEEDGSNLSDLSECHWTLGKSMAVARSGVAVCALNGKIYACGGRNRSVGMYYKTVECYDCEKKEWRHLESMHMKRAWAGCVVCNGIVYVFGGYDGTDRLDSVEAFDPVNETWSTLDTRMSFKRAGCAAAVT